MKSKILVGLTLLALGACSPPVTPADGGGTDAPAPLDARDGAPPVDTGPSCIAPQTLCGSSCTNVQTDPSNCGMCGAACAAGETCTAGRCGVTCPAGQMVCGGLCVTVSTDSANCGMCGRACAAGQVCAAGMCTLTCPAPLTTCGGGDGGARACADTQTDESNCGMCGRACAPGQTCRGGMCALECAMGQMNCSGRCVDTRTDNANCGACGMACPAGQACAAGMCTTTCAMGQTACGGRCVDTQSDPANCGMCGMACPAGQACVAGGCGATCGTGTRSCGGRCVDTNIDRTNCGACGTTCAAGQVCTGGACASACGAGQTFCGGACVNTGVDPANCGACGMACAAGQVCVAGACTPIGTVSDAGCAAPSRVCGGVCTDVRSDNTNCGTCGMACSADRVCVNGSCLTPCAAGERRCGAAGTCTNTQFDRSNCGACGMVCAGGQTCLSGACVSIPTFRVNTLATSACSLSANHESDSGDDAGGFAVGASSVVYDGDSATIVMSAGDLSGITVVPGARMVSLASDMRAGLVYAFLDSGGGPVPTSSFPSGNFTFAQLGQLNPTTGALTATRVTLSTPITVSSSQAGIYSGYGRIVVYTGTIGTTAQGWYNIDMPSGVVTAIRTGSTVSPPTNVSGCETFANWGIAEFYAGEVHVLYARSFASPAGIGRYTPRTDTYDPTLLVTASSMGDICMIGFSPARNRWYFHYEGPPDFAPPPAGTFGEFIGYCGGTYDTP